MLKLLVIQLFAMMAASGIMINQTVAVPKNVTLTYDEKEIAHISAGYK